MKKILNILASLLVISSPAGAVVSCGKISKPPLSVKHPDSVSNDEIASAVVEELTNTFKISIDNLKTSNISLQEIKTNLQSVLPTTLKINNVLIKTYSKSLISFNISGGKNNLFIGDDLATIQISYNGMKAKKPLLVKVNDKNDDKVVALLNKLCQKTNQLNFKSIIMHKTVIIRTLKNNIDKLFNNNINKSIYTVVANTDAKNVFVDVNANGDFSDGYFNFKVKNSNTHILNHSFTYKFNTPVIKSYKMLRDTFNSNSQNLSFSLRDLSLASFLPNTFISSHFEKTNEITKFLNEFTIGDFIDDLLNPTGKFAKLMPTDMPILDSNGIIKSSKEIVNKPFWDYINSLILALKNNYNLDASQGDLASNAGWNLSPTNSSINVKVKMSIDLYNIVKSIMPDLIHFHNYLINHEQISDSTNYLLAFINYLEDSKKDYPIKFSNKTDDFSKVNVISTNEKNAPILNTNFDNLIYDLIDPFTIGKNNSGMIGVHIEALVMLTKAILTYANIASDVSLTDSILNSVLNTLLKNKNGQDINQAIAANFDVSATVLAHKFTGTMVNNLNLAKLHILELKTLIAKQFKINGFDRANYEIESGKVFLQGKDKQTSNWKDLHSLDELVKVNDLRFQFRNMSFKISDPINTSVFVKENNLTMNLTL